MHIMDVPVDVLDHVVSLLEQADALRFALTCRCAYALSVRPILSHVTLGRASRLCAHDHLRLFCDYVLVDLPRRARYIRSLTLYGNAWLHEKNVDDTDCTVFALFARILSLATGTRALAIHNADTLVRTAPAQLVRALASLENLHEIRILIRADAGALQILSEIKSRTKSMLVCVYGDTRAGTPSRDRFVHDFTHSLEDFTLVNSNGFLTAVAPHTVWPAVRRLTVGGTETIDLPALARAFPDVRALALYGRCTDEQPAEGAWPALDSVETTAPPPLARRVRRMELVGDAWSTVDCANAVQMFARMAPTVLSCLDADLRGASALVASFAPSVRFLHYGYTGKQSGQSLAVRGLEDVGRWLDGYNFAALRRASLLGLVVPVDGSSVSGQQSWLPLEDLLELAVAIITRVPSLVYVGMSSCKSPTDIRWHQVVERLDSKRPLVEALSSCKGEQVGQILWNLPQNL